MFLNKYLNSTYLNLIYDNYEDDFLNMLDEDTFKKIYNLLKSNNFSYIEDIILNYLELFEIEEEYVNMALLDITNILGNDYVEQIGNNMTIFSKIIDLALKYSMMNN